MKVTTYDKNLFDTVWFLGLKQKGTVKVQLLQWTGDEYRLVKKWEAASPLISELDAGNGLLEVADLTQKADKGKVNRKPKCPISLEEAKKVALESLRAGDFGCAAMLHSLVQVQPGKIGRNAGGIPFEVAVLNNSPWSVQSVTVTSHDHNILQGKNIIGRY